MSADQVDDFSPAFAGALAEALCRETDVWARRDMAAGLTTLAKSWRTPDPIAVRSVVEQLAGAMKAEKDPARCGRLAQAAASMAERLGEPECSTACRAMATVLVSYANSDSGFDREQEWVRGLGELMIRVPGDVSVPMARLIAKSAAAVKIGPYNNNSYPARAFYEVVNEMNADDAARTAPVLAAALGQERDPNIRWWLAAGLGMMVIKMDPDDASQLCGPVLGDIGDAMAPGSYVRSTLIDAFNIVASRQASAVAGRWARVLVDMIKNEDSASPGQFGTALVHGLAVVVGRMEALEAQRICGELAQKPKALVDLFVRGLDGDTTDVAVLVRRMNSVDAECIRAEAVRAINDFVEQNPSTVSAARALVQLATLMEPLEAERLRHRANRIVGDALAFDSDADDAEIVCTCRCRETNESGGGGAHDARCADTGDGSVRSPVAGGNPRGCRRPAGSRSSDADLRPHDPRSAAHQVGPTPRRAGSPWLRFGPGRIIAAASRSRRQFACHHPRGIDVVGGRYWLGARTNLVRSKVRKWPTARSIVSSLDGHEPTATGPSPRCAWPFNPLGQDRARSLRR